MKNLCFAWKLVWVLRVQDLNPGRRRIHTNESREFGAVITWGTGFKLDLTITEDLWKNRFHHISAGFGSGARERWLWTAGRVSRVRGAASPERSSHAVTSFTPTLGVFPLRMFVLCRRGLSPTCT